MENNTKNILIGEYAINNYGNKNDNYIVIGNDVEYDINNIIIGGKNINELFKMTDTYKRLNNELNKLKKEIFNLKYNS